METLRPKHKKSAYMATPVPERGEDHPEVRVWAFTAREAAEYLFEDYVSDGEYLVAVRIGGHTFLGI